MADTPLQSGPDPDGDEALRSGGESSGVGDVTLTWSGEAEAAPLEKTIPRQLGHLRVEEEIGRGGMGVVHAGWDTVLRRRVAIKFLLGAAPAEGDPHFEQFLVGAQAEAAVRHPNIVAVHLAGLVENLPYLVMDYIDGPSLRLICRHSGPLSPAAAVKVVCDVAGATAALHEEGFVHRDLKPANVIFDRGGRPFVTDFGLAVLRRRSAGTFALAGTPTYMAPEAFDGRMLPQTDVYALGILLFELLAGEPPYVGGRERLAEQHRSAPLPVEKLRARVGDDVVEIIERATHKQDIFRHKSARHLQRALAGSGARADVLREGQTELQVLVTRTLAACAGLPAERPGERTPSCSYFDRISEIAERKRQERGTSDTPTPRPPEETIRLPLSRPPPGSAPPLLPPPGDRPEPGSAPRPGDG